MNFCLAITFTLGLVVTQAQGSSWTSTSTSTSTFTAILQAYFQNVTTTTTQTAKVPLPAVPSANGQSIHTAHLDLLHIDIFNQTNTIANVIIPLTCAILNLGKDKAIMNGNIEIEVYGSNGSPITFNLSSLVTTNRALVSQIALLIQYLNQTDQLLLPFGNDCNDCNGKQIVLNFLQFLLTLTKVTAPDVNIHSSNLAILKAVVQVFAKISTVQWNQLLSSLLGSNITNTDWLGQLGQYVFAIFVAILKNSITRTQGTLPIPIPTKILPTRPPIDWNPVTLPPATFPPIVLPPVTQPPNTQIPSSLQANSGNAINVIQKALLSAPNGIGGILQLLTGNIGGILNGLTSGQNGNSGTNNNTPNGIGGILQLLSGNIGGILKGITSGQNGNLGINLKSIITIIQQFIVQLIQGIIKLPEGVVKTVTVLSGQVGSAVGQVLTAVTGTTKFNIELIIKFIQQLVAQLIQLIVKLPQNAINTIQQLSAGVGSITGEVASSLAQTSGLIMPINLTKFFQSGGSPTQNLNLFANVSALSASTVLPCVVQQFKTLH